MSLHKIVKGEDLPVLRDGKGPMTAPGQKIKLHDLSRGRAPPE